MSDRIQLIIQIFFIVREQIQQKWISVLFNKTTHTHTPTHTHTHSHQVEEKKVVWEKSNIILLS